MRYFKEALSGRPLIEYTRKYSNIDPEIFEEICKLDPTSSISGDQLLNIGAWAKQILLPNYLKGETDFLTQPDEVRTAIQNYFPNIAKYPKPAEFKSVADFLEFMKNPETADIETIKVEKDDPLTAAYKQYYSDIPREIFDKLIALDPLTTKDRIGEIARNLILPKYQAGDRSALSKSASDIRDILSIYYNTKAEGIYPAEALILTSYRSLDDFLKYIKKGPDSAFVVSLKNDTWEFNAPEHRYPHRRDEKTNREAKDDIEFIGATSEYNILSPRSQLANFAISGGYTTSNGNQWCTSAQVGYNHPNRQHFDWWNSYQDRGTRVYVDFMRKGHERGTENRIYNWQLNINPTTGDIQQFLNGNDQAGNLQGNTADDRFATFLLQHQDIIPVIKNHPYFVNSIGLKKAETNLKLANEPLEINSFKDAANLLAEASTMYSAVVKKVIIRNLDKIPNGLFSDFSLLTDAIFEGDSLKIIGADAFKGCPIKTLNLPEGLQEIQEEAFANCQLHGSIRLPDSLEKIGYRAFNGNSGFRLKLNSSRGRKLKIAPEDKNWAMTYISVIDVQD